MKVNKVDEHLHGGVGEPRYLSVECRARYVAYFGLSESYQTAFIISETQTFFASFKGLLMSSVYYV